MKAYLAVLSVIAVALASATPSLGDQTGMADMHDQRREGSKICLSGHFHTGVGKGRTKRAARAAAIKAWQEFTAFEYGLDWAYFRTANSKGIGYERSSDAWEATVEARPCRRR